MNKDKQALMDSVLSMKKLLTNTEENLNFDLLNMVSDDLSLLQSLLKVAREELETLKINSK